MRDIGSKNSDEEPGDGTGMKSLETSYNDEVANDEIDFASMGTPSKLPSSKFWYSSLAVIVNVAVNGAA